MTKPISASVRITSNRIDAVRRTYADDVRARVQRHGFNIEAGAKNKAPVDTGTLRRSIHTVISDDGRRATVGPSVDYGGPVELGTRHMPARPYLRPAAESEYPKFVDGLKSDLRRAK